MRNRWRAAFGLGVVVSALTFVSSAGAQQTGNTALALPGFARVGVAEPAPPNATFALTAGYGMTEAQEMETGSHHRFRGVLGASVRPIDWLAFALNLDGRYDVHPDDGIEGTDDGWVGDPRIIARAGSRVGGPLLVGGELVVWIPGIDAPSLEFGATTIDAKLLAAISPEGSGFTAGIHAGYRLDNSAESAPADAAQLRRGDRLALGISSYDAILLGLGAGFRADALEVFGELTWDMLIGDGAPSATESPMRVTAGARYHASDSLQLELLADVSASSRPAMIAAADPYVPIEPRFSVLFGARYALPFDRPEEVVSDDVLGDGGGPTPAATTGTVRGRVLDPQGNPVAGATVKLTIGGETMETTSGADGTYVFENVPPGDAQITIVAEGFGERTASVAVRAGEEATGDQSLEQAAPSGQLRGLIRSFSGEGLAARIRVEPIGVEATTDAQGYFQIDVPPGTYDVVIEADGHEGQRRSVSVEENGVTVLNADLRGGR